MAPDALVALVREVRPSGDPREQAHRIVAVVVEGNDVRLAVGVEIERPDLHATEVEAVRGLEEPLRGDDLRVCRRAVEDDDVKAEVVARVVERRDLLISRALEVARDGVTLPERLPACDRLWGDRRDEPNAGDHEREKESHSAAESHPR